MNRSFKNVMLSTQERFNIRKEIQKLKALAEKLTSKAVGLEAVLQGLESFKNVELAEFHIQPYLKKLENITLNYDTNIDSLLSKEDKHELLEKIMDFQNLDLTGLFDEIITFGDLTSLMDAHNNG